MSTKFATFTTPRGTIVAELYARDCPVTVENFEALANSGFYDGVQVHAVAAGRSVHSGDPLSRTVPVDDARIGTGGPGYTIPCELVGNRNTHVRGALSMDHTAPHTGGSRFCFVLSDEVGAARDGRHTVFGQVEEGLDVLSALEPHDLIVRVRVWE